MQSLEVSGAVRPIYGPLGVKRLKYLYIRQNDITLHVPIVSRSYTPYQRFYHHNLLYIIVSADDTASITLDHTLFKHNKTRASVCV